MQSFCLLQVVFLIFACVFWNLPFISETYLRCPVIRVFFPLGVRRGLVPRTGSIYLYASFTGHFHREHQSQDLGVSFFMLIIFPREESSSFLSGEFYTEFQNFGNRVGQEGWGYFSYSSCFPPTALAVSWSGVSWSVDSIVFSLENKLLIFWGVDWQKGALPHSCRAGKGFCASHDFVNRLLKQLSHFQLLIHPHFQRDLC